MLLFIAVIYRRKMSLVRNKRFMKSYVANCECTIAFLISKNTSYLKLAKPESL